MKIPQSSHGISCSFLPLFCAVALFPFSFVFCCERVCVQMAILRFRSYSDTLQYFDDLARLCLCTYDGHRMLCVRSTAIRNTNTRTRKIIIAIWWRGEKILWSRQSRWYWNRMNKRQPSQAGNGCRVTSLEKWIETWLVRVIIITTSRLNNMLAARAART